MYEGPYCDEISSCAECLGWRLESAQALLSVLEHQWVDFAGLSQLERLLALRRFDADQLVLMAQTGGFDRLSRYGYAPRACVSFISSLSWLTPSDLTTEQWWLGVKAAACVDRWMRGLHRTGEWVLILSELQRAFAVRIAADLAAAEQRSVASVLATYGVAA